MAGVIQANAMKDKSELLSILTNRFDTVYSQSRLRTIANTVSANVTAGSQLATYKRLGYTYIWLTEQDNRVRPSHQIMEGKEVDPDGFFSVPVMKKGITDEGAVGEIIVGYEKTERPLGGGLSASGAVNCRCQLFPVQRQTTETVTVQKPSTGTSAPNTPSGSNLPRVIAGGRGGQLKAIADFERRYADLRSHEMGMLVDYDGTEISGEITGKKTSVNVYDNFSRKKISELVKSGRAIMSHNHPGGSSFSDSDIALNIGLNQAEMRAVGPRYTYVIQRPADGYEARNKHKAFLEKTEKYSDDGFDMPNSFYANISDQWRQMAFDIKYNFEFNFPNMTREEIAEEWLEMYDAYKSGILGPGASSEIFSEYATHAVNLRMAKKYKYDYQRIITGG
jgi:hypothetical protein